MLGKLVSLGVNLTSLPLRAVNIGVDKVTGGTGSKSSRKELPILGDIEDGLDILAEEAEEWDK